MFSILNKATQAANVQIEDTAAAIVERCWGSADMTETATVPPTIAEMLRGYSIEVNPSDSKTVDAARECLDAGTEVFLTWIPGADPMDLIRPAEKLHRRGLIPVPHIGARHLQSADQLERLAGRLAGEAGVDRV